MYARLSSIYLINMKIRFPFVKHPKHRAFEYNQIDKNIFIGTNMCCVTHFDDELIKKNITVDISLEGENMDHPKGAKVFCWLPTKDHTSPTPQQLQTGVDMITSVVKQKQKAYVHCQNGHGRAPTLVAAYYISKGMTTEDAIKKIQEKRSTIHLEENQIKALRKFYKKIS